ncbi:MULTISPECIES: sodium/glutamate symporter [unclassified Halorhodospira]|uniref:sodium/glutamate symporter n=1 Tax=unclassified Halorhodospira TaxID=2626748 RepID=UPI001EE8ECE5|nr:MULTISPECIES: sodium:glutamate symporter [unclassified Halorhodospira]MCG5540579.1 sodium:glutamate symporter [Halorhodospira sp. M39old]MCG5546222.1 sodium:glutamate symporter [Halorhodospira sp. M38]
MAVAEILIAILVLCLLVLASSVLRAYTLWARRLFLPASIIAGAVALLLGPEVLGRFIGSPFEDGAGLFPDYVYDTWSAIPGLLISVVFAALFLGKPLPGLREIWLRAGPQVVVGQTMAWGQYVVGILLALLVLTPVFGLSPMAGALIEIGFEGGHGTAAGMAGTFEDLGFPAGADLALGLATVGLVGGVVVGTILINLAVRRGIIDHPENAQGPGSAQERFSDRELHLLRRDRQQESQTTDPLTVHLGLVALAVVLGWGMLSALQWLEAVTWARDSGVEILQHVPLFPMAMLGGVLLQVFIIRSGYAEYVSERSMSRISGTALDFTIVAALATLSLTALGEHLVPFLLLAATGIAWSLFVLVVIAPRVIPFDWFERGVGDFGQSMGVTVTGVLLMRMADPNNRSGALESFGYKQLLFEPIVGGGLFTAASVPLIYQFGPVPVLILAAVVTTAWLALGFLYFGRMVPDGGRGRLRPAARG